MISAVLERFFDANNLMPHAMCFLWRPELLVLHVTADAAIAISYFVIPGMLYLVARKRPDIVQSKVFHLFAAFILLCGLTHAMGIWVMWNPAYALQGIVKFVTALVSVTTALVVWKMLPKLQKIPTVSRLAESNRQLMEEVNKRQQAELELEKTQQMLAHAQSLARLTAWDWKIKTDELRFAPQAADLLGPSVDEAAGSGDSFFDFVHPDDRFRRDDALAALVTRGMPMSIEYRVVKSGNSTLRVHEFAEPAATENGRVTHIIGAIQDITASAESLDNLMESENRFRSVFENAPIGIATTMPDGQIVDVNECLAELLGYTIEELKQKNLKDIVHPSDSPYGDLDDSDFKFGKFQCEKRYIHKNGSVVWARVSMSQIKDASDKAVSTLIQILPITAEKEMEEIQAKQKRLIDSLYRSSEISFIDADLTEMYAYVQFLKNRNIGDFMKYMTDNPQLAAYLQTTFKVNDLNETARRFGGTETSAETKAALESFSKFEKENHNRTMLGIAQALWNGADSIRKEDTFRKLDGSEMSVVYSLPLPKSEKEARNVPIITVEVTDIQRTITAEAASKAKSSFLAKMSHEIRTPMNGVVANIDILKSTKLDKNQEQIINDMKVAADTLLQLIGDILDLSKIEAGKIELNNTPMQINQLAGEMESLFVPRARQSGLSFTVGIGSNVPEEIEADYLRIKQNLMNLIGNAVKFTREGGIYVEVLAESFSDNVCMLKFNVHDSGIGLNTAQSQHIFDTFTQHNRSIAQKYGGSGLGLSIVKSLAKQAGGNAGVEGMEGEGCTFWFTWPVKILRHAGLPCRPALSPIQSIHLLDHPVPDMSLRTYAQARNIEIVEVRSPEEAIATAKSGSGTAAGTKPCVLVVYGDEKHWPSRDVINFFRHSNRSAILSNPGGDWSSIRRALRLGFRRALTRPFDAEAYDRSLGRFGNRQTELADAIGRHDGAKPRKRTPKKAESLKGARILVLEDHVLNQRVVQRQLSSLGADFIIAADGLEGLEQFASGHFDLILTDCFMPHMDGYEFTRRIRRQEAEQGQGRRIPIVGLTANVFSDDIKRCHDAGMDDFISKPANIAILKDKLSHWLNVNAPAPAPAGKPAPNSASGRNPLDISFLSETIGSSDPLLINSLLGTFLEETQASVESLRKALSEKNAGNVTIIAHGAKGNARALGAKRLSRLFEEAEQLGQKNELTRIAALMEEVGIAMREAEEQIADILGSTPQSSGSAGVYADAEP